MQTDKHIQRIGVRAKRAPIFILGAFILAGVATLPFGASAAENLSAKIEKAREPVLKGERTASIKTFKELYRDANSAKTSKEIAQAWREVAELFLG